jgi:hypothetical protein
MPTIAAARIKLLHCIPEASRFEIDRRARRGRCPDRWNRSTLAARAARGERLLEKLRSVRASGLRALPKSGNMARGWVGGGACRGGAAGLAGRLGDPMLMGVPSDPARP